MKFLGYEDIIAGILLGIIMVGASGKFFTLPYNDLLLRVFLFLFLILAIIDIIYELKTIGEHIFFTIAAVVWNIIEILIVLWNISNIFKLNFGFIMALPVIGVLGLFGAGIFFVFGNIMWLYLYFKH